jgi:predicted phage terminase large subunit-like protein
LIAETAQPQTLRPINIDPFALFTATYLPHILKVDCCPMHLEFYKTGADVKKRRVARAAPRYHAKSVTFSFCFPLWRIFDSKDSRGIIISETTPFAQQWLRDIKTEIETNQLLYADYRIKPGKKWEERHIICERPDGSTFELMAKGKGTQVRGFHPDWVICDDLENDEEVRSDDQRAKNLDWFNKALINTLDEEEARLIYIGTILHPLSLLSDVMGREAWDCKTYKAIQPDGSALWPEKWPLDKLEARRKEIGDLAFSSEFMNEPIISENPVFEKKWFKTYDRAGAFFDAEDRKTLYRVTACDPAIGLKETNDCTAIVTLAASLDKNPKIFCTDARQGHWTVRDTLTQLSTVTTEQRQRHTILETTAFQEALAYSIREEEAIRKTSYGLIEVKPDKDKVRRAHAITPMVQYGDVYFDLTQPGQQKLLEQLILFPTGDHDDLVDAFVYAMQHLRDWNKPKATTTPSPHKSRQSATGYR